MAKKHDREFDKRIKECEKAERDAHRWDGYEESVNQVTQKRQAIKFNTLLAEEQKKIED